MDDCVLPPEILLIISKFTSFATTHSLTQTCKWMREHIIFYNIPVWLHHRLTACIVLRYPNIESLSLRYNKKIDVSCVKELKNLKYLDAFSSEIRDEDIKGLSLTHLRVSYCNNITNDAIARQQNLKLLDISYCWRITDEALLSLLSLTHLYVGYNHNITDRSIRELKNIRYLNLYANSRITDNGVSRLENLEEIELTHCDKITPVGLRKLPKLRRILTINCRHFDNGVIMSSP